MQAVVTDLSAVPEALREQYVPEGDKFVLKVEGDHPALVPQDRLHAAEKAAEAKFRDRNIAQAKELEAAQAKLKAFDGVDPAKYKELQEQVGKGSGGAVNAAEIARLVAQQVEAQNAPLRDELAQVKGTLQQKETALARKEVETALRDAASKSGIADSAIQDFLHRGTAVWTRESDGHLVAKTPDGEPMFSRTKAGQLLTPEEWARDLRAEAPHLYKPSAGGGSDGGRGSAGSGAGTGATRVIDASGPDGAWVIGQNLEDLASGKARLAG